MYLKTFIATTGVIVGIFFGEMFLYGSEITVLAFIISIVQFSIYFFEVHSLRKTRQVKDTRDALLQGSLRDFSIVLMSAIFFFSVSIGVLRVQFVHVKNNFVCTDACTFNATIITTPKAQNTYQVLTVRPKTEEDVYDVQVRAPLYPRLSIGENVSLFGKVTLPHTSMPHDGARFFNYISYLRIRDIGSEMMYPKIEQIFPSEGNDVLNPKGVAYLHKLRESFLDSISFYVNEPSASLASGMLFGQASMSKELVQTFRTAGLSHIVVLSGFNIAILISAVLFLLSFVPFFLRIILAAIFVILFVLMVGAEASIIRATIMSFIALGALLFGRSYTAKQALLLSLLCIILYEPASLLFDVSLHLSFLATAGIVYMSEGISNLLEKVRSKAYREIITTTTAAYIATLPYVMYTFGTASLYALITNLIILPVVPIAMLVTFLVVVLSPASSLLASIFGYVDTLLCGFIIFVARTIERLPFSSVSVSLSGWALIFFYVVIIFIYIFIIKKLNNETPDRKDGEIISEIISY